VPSLTSQPSMPRSESIPYIADFMYSESKLFPIKTIENGY
jgi:hypothetical protein